MSKSSYAYGDTILCSTDTYTLPLTISKYNHNDIGSFHHGDKTFTIEQGPNKIQISQQMIREILEWSEMK